MFLETSAIVEYIAEEPRANEMADRLSATTSPLVTAPTVLFEAAVVLSRKRKCSVAETKTLLLDFLEAMDVSVIPITPEIGFAAIDAFARYGKGRGHPAQLNFGDCFSYAACKAAHVPMLFVGDDFTKTDLA
ncbi:type II toxin-antitoxin system VapC family toxin [Pararhizobium sp. DWP3-4]|uniref:type II toxin-antitoxin system VapC family toxin n=1 Tax=unclassified Pararhizobium TaxID=2643050 RepID=UPI003CF3B16D